MAHAGSYRSGMDDFATRWASILLLRSRTPADHEWCALYESLVAAPALSAPQDRQSWQVFDPEGILVRLEAEADRLGLTADTTLDPYAAMSELFLARPVVKEIR